MTNMIIQKIKDLFLQKKNKTSKKKNIILNNGNNNRLVILNDDSNNESFLDNLQIEFLGSNNYIEIYSSCIFANNIKISCTNNNVIKIGRNFKGNFNIPCPMSNGCSLIIGDNVNIIFANIPLHDEPNLKVLINNDVLISYGVEIRVSDGHTIFETDSNKVLNMPANITIGQHCWVGMNTLILKGSHVPNNSIIGAGSIYLKNSFNSAYNNNGGYLFAGQPAKVIRKNINWDIKNTYIYKDSIVSDSFSEIQ